MSPCLTASAQPAAASRLGRLARVRASSSTKLGWWKAPTRFLPCGRFDGRLAADGGVHHREHRRRHVGEAHAPGVGGRHEAGQIAYDPASHRDEQVPPLRAKPGEPVVQVARAPQRLGLLPGRQHEDVRDDPRGLHRRLRALGVPVGALIGHHVGRGGRHRARGALSELVENAPSGPDRVGAGRRADHRGQIAVGGMRGVFGAFSQHAPGAHDLGGGPVGIETVRRHRPVAAGVVGLTAGLERHDPAQWIGVVQHGAHYAAARFTLLLETPVQHLGRRFEAHDYSRLAHEAAVALEGDDSAARRNDLFLVPADFGQPGVLHVPEGGLAVPCEDVLDGASRRGDDPPRRRRRTAIPGSGPPRGPPWSSRSPRSP